MKLSFRLNGAAVTIETDALRQLIDVLRTDFALPGVKEGCGEGECGTCSVLIDDQLQLSCILPVGLVEGKSVETIEGFRTTPRFEALCRAFARAGAVQCGYCTPGMILAAEALLRANPDPSESAVRDALAGNICRCTGYTMIVDAVLLAAKEGRGLW